jgi:AcrR family transcriptional regulator
MPRLQARPLDAEAIIAKAEQAIRQYGLAKTTVLDVSRALDVSHATIYRYFPSKMALCEAVVDRWLDRSHSSLSEIVDNEDTPPAERLRAWLRELFEGRQRGARSDPALNSALVALSAKRSRIVTEHARVLLTQVQVILASGIDAGQFFAFDPAAAAQAILDATSRFHDPVNAAGWNDTNLDIHFERVCDLIFSGILASAIANRDSSA